MLNVVMTISAMDPEGGDGLFLRTFPQLKLRVEDSGILDDLEVQEIPDPDSDNHHEGGDRVDRVSDDASDDDCPVHSENKQRTDPDMFFSRLPDELWIEILRDFSPFELCRLGLTCKALLRLSR